MIVAAEKQKRTRGAEQDTGFEYPVEGIRSQPILVRTSNARIVAKRVKSMVLPARSARDNDLALSVALVTSFKPISGGSSKGPGFTRSRWVVESLSVRPADDDGKDVRPFKRTKATEEEIKAAMNLTTVDLAPCGPFLVEPDLWSAR